MAKPKRGLEYEMFCGASIPRKTIKEKLGCGGSQLISRLRNRGEGGVGCLREVEIVKAHE
jgi:hypothetical protein